MPPVMTNVATTPGFTSPWTDYDFSGQWGPVRYYKDIFGVVHIAGLIAASPFGSGATTQTMFQLPVGYRPGTGSIPRQVFYCRSNESGILVARVDVLSDGSLVYIAGGRQWISLSQIHFPANG